MGDQKKQYTRLRDYPLATLDTNPGSRCIVTCTQLLEHPSEKIPRIIYLLECIKGRFSSWMQAIHRYVFILAYVACLLA
jgi:hypothetical protein